MKMQLEQELMPLKDLSINGLFLLQKTKVRHSVQRQQLHEEHLQHTQEQSVHRIHHIQLTHDRQPAGRERRDRVPAPPAPS